jgi:outer membrane protein assembly factor BamA
MKTAHWAPLLLALAATAAAASPPATGPAPAETAALPDDATLEAAGARFGTITIRTGQIFDEKNPHENYGLYRIVNRLHLHTHAGAVRSALLFRTGDPYQGRLLQETERNLRQLNYLREPRVRAVAWHDGVVDILVETHDVWTLQIGPSYARSGGKNAASLEVKDINLFGYGKTLLAGYSKDVDRSSTYFEWQDPSVLRSHWVDDLRWANNSDGHDRSLQIYRPFYALDVRHGGGLTITDKLGTDTRYKLGDEYDHYTHALRLFDVYGGWSPGLRNGHTVRYTLGWHSEHDDFSPVLSGNPPVSSALAPIPADRDLVYPYVQMDWIADQYATTHNRDQIGRTEDLHFGLTAMFQLGVSAPAFGADRHALITNNRATYGWQLTDQQQLFASGSIVGRLEQGRFVDLRTGGDAAWYWRASRHRLTFVRISGDTGKALDLDHYYLLGGDNGLRGYPLRYQEGSGRAQFSVEERLYSDWTLWSLFDVGGAVFFDTGRTFGSSPVGTPQLGWLRDVGLGLRLGNNRSSLGNVIYIDVAAPLDGDNIKRLQLLVGASATF